MPTVQDRESPCQVTQLGGSFVSQTRRIWRLLSLGVELLVAHEIVQNKATFEPCSIPATISAFSGKKIDIDKGWRLCLIFHYLQFIFSGTRPTVNGPTQVSFLVCLLHTMGEWKDDFSRRENDLDLQTENTPYIEWGDKLRDDCDGETPQLSGEDQEDNNEEPDEEDNVIRKFMRGHHEPDDCLPRADKVEGFCIGANLESLKQGKGTDCKALHVALLDERSREGARRNRGPLTASGLYWELKRPVSCPDLALGSGHSEKAAI